MNNKEQQQDHNNGEEKQNRILGINGNDEKEEGKDKDKIVDEHEECHVEESDEQTFENSWNGRDGG